MNAARRFVTSSVIALVLAATPGVRGEAPKPIECLGHEIFVVSVVVSPDGKLVASGSDDQTLRIWNAADGKAVHVVKADPATRGGWVGAATFAPDGRTLAASFPVKGVQFFDSVTGKATDRSPVRDAVYGLAFSADGRKLAGAGHDWVRVWDVAKGDKLHEFTFDRSIGRAWRVAFSPDGKHLAAALHRYGGREQEAPRVRVWELAADKEVFAAWEDGGHANAVAFSPDGKMLAACGEGEDEGTVEVYDWAAKKRLYRIQADKHVVFCLAFSADGKTLFTGGNEPGVKLWHAATGKAAGQLEGNTDQVADLALSKDGKVLATAGRDKRVLIWHLDKKER